MAPHNLGDDEVVTRSARRVLFGSDLVVEEKLDGANVSVMLENGRPVAMSRSGKTSRDRGGQLGRLRAWCAEHHGALVRALGAGRVLYAEWLYRTHTVVYDQLPSYFVLLDIWEPERGFWPVEDRDAVAALAGLSTPPLLHRGPVRDVDELRALHAVSRFGSEPAEGLIVRLESGGSLAERVKLLRPGFVRKTDEAWRGERRVNGLRAESSSAGLRGPGHRL